MSVCHTYLSDLEARRGVTDNDPDISTRFPSFLFLFAALGCFEALEEASVLFNVVDNFSGNACLFGAVGGLVVIITVGVDDFTVTLVARVHVRTSPTSEEDIMHGNLALQNNLFALGRCASRRLGRRMYARFVRQNVHGCKHCFVNLLGYGTDD